jgi:CheY-like chemotaxis protein
VRQALPRRGKFLEQQRYQLCLTDMRLPDGEGLEIVG